MKNQSVSAKESSSLEETEHDWDAGGYCPALYGDPCRCSDEKLSQRAFDAEIESRLEREWERIHKGNEENT